jgi:hypothetical protein
MKRQGKRMQQKARAKRASTRTKREFLELRTVEQFFAMPEADRDFWADVGQIATEVKGGVSLSQSARKYRRDPRKVRQAAPAAFRKLKNGRYAVKANDHILRVLLIPTRKGLREIGVLHPSQASLIGQYWTAVERYRDTGDASALREFRGKQIIDASGKRVPLLTHPLELDRLGSAGVLSFESLYARAA